MFCNGKRGHGNAAANTRDKHVRARRNAGARNQHSVGGEMSQANGGGLRGIMLRDVKNVGDGRGEKFRVRARRMLADHVNVLASGLVVGSVGGDFRNRGHKNDALAKPRWINTGAKFDHLANAVGAANGWPRGVNARHAASNPQIQMIQRGNFCLNLHFARVRFRCGASGDKVYIGSDGGCLFGNFKGIHEQSVTMLVRNIE